MNTLPRLSFRRLAVIGVALLVAVLSCGREPTAPGGGGHNAGVVRSQGLAFLAEFPKALADFQAAGGSVPFEKVHIVLNNPDGSVALDTTVTFPAGASELQLTLSVLLPPSTPASGQPLALNLDYLNAAGQSVFHGGPVTVTAVPQVPGQGPPPPSPVTIPVTYTGPGANAKSVVITPASTSVPMGSAFAFTAQALDANNQPVANTPIVFNTSNAAIAPINAATGAGTAGNVRGTATITAQTLTGLTASASLTVTPAAGALTLVSGDAQTGTTGQTLTKPIAVRLTAKDGLPMPGAAVTFATASAGGSVTPSSAIADADGVASASWKLGSTVGAQQASATVAGLPAVTFGATAKAPDPVKLAVVTAPPASVAADQAFGFSAQAVDASNALTPGFTGSVTVTATGGSGTLGGTTSVNAVGGVATFSDLKFTVPGTYTLAVGATGLTGATVGQVTVTAGAVKTLTFTGYPGTTTAGNPLATVQVELRDANGNLATNYTGAVKLALASGPATATLLGTTSVQPVAGVASFPGLALTMAGTYTLSASTNGLSKVGNAFGVVAGAAQALSLAGGGGQAATGGAALPAPVVVMVSDLYGNPVSGVTVTFAPTAGSASPTSAVSGTSGLAQTNWTLGPSAGSQTLNVSGTGLTPNPLAVTATATGGAASWNFTSDYSMTSATFHNWSVGSKIGGGAFVLATDTTVSTAQLHLWNVPPTYGNCDINRSGTTISVFTAQFAPGQTSCHPGSGPNDQAGVRWTSPITGTVLVTANLTGISTAGGVGTTVNTYGYFNNTRTWTDSIRGSVTLPVGSRQQVTFSGVKSVVPGDVIDIVMDNAGLFSADAVGVAITIVPTAATAGSATQLAFQTQPAGGLASTAMPSFTVVAKDGFGNVATGFTGNVTLAIGSNPGGATLGGTLTVAAVAGVATFSNVTLSAAGTGYTLRASSGALTATASTTFNITSATAFKTWTGAVNTDWNNPGNWSPAGVPSVTTDSVIVPGGGSSPVLSAAGFAKNLRVIAPATVSMGANNLTVGYSLYAGGGITSSGGVVTLQGDGVSNSNVGNLTGRINANVNVTGGITLAADDTIVGNLSVNTNGFVQASASTPLRIVGNLSTAGGLFSLTGGVVVTVTGNVTYGPGFAAALNTGTMNIAGNLTVDASLNGSGPTPQQCCFNGSYVFNGSTAQTITFGSPTTQGFGVVTFANPAGVAIPSNFIGSGNLNITAGAVNVTGHTITMGSGWLNDPAAGLTADSLIFTGNTTPIAAATPTINANLRFTKTTGSNLLGNVTVNGSATAWAGAVIPNGHTLKVNGNFITTNTGSLQMTNAVDSVVVSGNATFSGGTPSLTAGTLIIGGDFTQNTSATAFVASATHETHFANLSGAISHLISFAHPNFTQSRFANLYLGDTLVTLGSPVYADGELETGVAPTIHLKSVTGDRLVTTRGGNVRNLTFDDVRWLLVDGAAVLDMDHVTFTGISATTQVQMEVQRTGAIPMVNFTYWTFATVPTGGGLYLKVTDTDGATNGVTTVTMGSPGAPTPTANGGFTAVVNGAVINGWPNIATWLGATSTDWHTASNWSSGAVPGATTDVVIAAGTNAPTTTAAANAKNLTINTGVTLTVGGASAPLTIAGDLTISPSGVLNITGNSAVAVSGNVTTDTAGATGVRGCNNGGQALNLQAGTHTVTGKFCNLSVFGNYSASGPIVVDTVATPGALGGTLTIQNAGANLTVGGMRIKTYRLTTSTSGTLTMGNGADSVIVANTATFSGGPTAGLLTAGNLVISGPTFSATGLAFDATGTHVTSFTGTAFQTVGFGSAVAGHGFKDIVFRNNGQKNFSGDQYITGNMTCDNTITTGGVNGSYHIYIAGNIIDNATTATGCWNGSTALHITGTPTTLPAKLGVNSVIFNGGGTITLSNNLITNYITVDGAGTRLKLNGHYVTTNGNDFTTQNGGTLEMTAAGDSLATGRAFFNGGSEAGLLTQGGFVVNHFTQGVNPAAFVADSTHRTWAYGGVFNFANPGYGASLSHFGTLINASSSSSAFSSDVFVEGQFRAASAIQNVILNTVDRTLTARGAVIPKVDFTHTRFVLLDGQPVTQLDNMRFKTMGGFATTSQLDIQRTGSGLSGSVPATWANPSFDTPPSTGSYVSMSGGPGTSISVTGQFPSVVQVGQIVTSGGWTLNWPTGVNTLLASGLWTSNASWSANTPPDSQSSVLIPAGMTVTLSSFTTYYAKNITVQPTGVVAMGAGSLEAHGNVVADTALGQGFTCSTGILYQPDLVTGTLTGRLCRYHSGGTITQNGPVIVDSVFHVHDGTYTFAGRKVVTKEAWVGTANVGGPGGTGALVMTNAADSLVVSDSLLVGNQFNTGAASTLSAGTVVLGGNFRQIGSPGTGYWQPTGTHVTTATGVKQIFFTDTTASGFRDLRVSGTRTLASVARVTRDLYVVGASAINGTSGRAKVLGNLYGGTSSSITARAVEIAGTLSDTGTFNPDTTVFTGSGQTVVDTLAGTTSGPTFKSIRVTGTLTMLVNSANFNWSIGGKLIADGGQVRIGNGAGTTYVQVSDSLITKNNGTIKMIDAASTLAVAGHALFAGGSTTGLLTDGKMEFQGNFTENGATTAYAPSGAHEAGFTGTVQQTVTFTHGATSAFNDVDFRQSGGTIQFASDATAVGKLKHSNPLGETLTSSVASPWLLTVGGLNNSGPYPLTFSNVRLKFVEGTSTATFNNVTFSGFASAYAGTMFEVARTTGGPFTFNNLTWSGTLNTSTGRYLVNSGSQAITLVSPVPGAVSGAAAGTCGCTTFQQVTGSGSITWP